MISDAKYKLEIGDSAIDFSLPGTDGNIYTLKSFHSRILIIFFTCNHCPYAQAYEERIKEFQNKHKGVIEFVAINSNDSTNYPEDSFEQMKLRAKQHAWNFPYLYDETQEVAEKYGAECTPHFLLFDEYRKLRYQGHFDDHWRRAMVKSEDLKNAIDAILKGETILKPITNAQGCSIKWKQERYGIY